MLHNDALFVLFLNQALTAKLMVPTELENQGIKVTEMLGNFTGGHGNCILSE